ncbi:hypothetical protein E0E53_04470 [Azotobacter chroococcum]|nr:hypothetical protein E0E53_04470 [Azotobacter chroococcum]
MANRPRERTHSRCFCCCRQSQPALLRSPAASSRAQLIRIGELLVNKRHTPPASGRRVAPSI